MHTHAHADAFSRPPFPRFPACPRFGPEVLVAWQPSSKLRRAADWLLPHTGPTLFGRSSLGTVAEGGSTGRLPGFKHVRSAEDLAAAWEAVGQRGREAYAAGSRPPPLYFSPQPRPPSSTAAAAQAQQEEQQAQQQQQEPGSNSLPTPVMQPSPFSAFSNVMLATDRSRAISDVGNDTNGTNTSEEAAEEGGSSPAWGGRKGGGGAAAAQPPAPVLGTWAHRQTRLRDECGTRPSISPPLDPILESGGRAGPCSQPPIAAAATPRTQPANGTLQQQLRAQQAQQAQGNGDEGTTTGRKESGELEAEAAWKWRFARRCVRVAHAARPAVCQLAARPRGCARALPLPYALCVYANAQVAHGADPPARQRASQPGQDG